MHFNGKFIYYDELIPAIKKCRFGILPYREATQSGVIYLFNSLKKPLIITDKGGLKEQVSDRTAIITEYSEQALAKNIKKMVQILDNNEIRDEDFSEINEKQNMENSVKKLLIIYRRLINE